MSETGCTKIVAHRSFNKYLISLCHAIFIFYKADFFFKISIYYFFYSFEYHKTGKINSQLLFFYPADKQQICFLKRYFCAKE